MLKILIVEDNLMIADLVADLLKAKSYDVIGIARTVAEAVRLCQARQPDCAIVNLHLADDIPGSELMGHLGQKTRMGILFASDSVSGIPLTSDQGLGFIIKPFRVENLLEALAIVAEIQTKGSSSLPYPLGFRLLNVAPA